MPNPLLEYPPYASYVAQTRNIDEFVSLTTISYKLAQQLLFSTPRDQLPEIKLKEPAPDRRSYAMGDRRITNARLSSAWLRYDAYAEREGIDIDVVKTRAEAGELGPIRPNPKDGAPMALWPPEDQRPEGFQAPEVGSVTLLVEEEQTYDASLTEDFDLSNPEELAEARRLYLALAHSLGNTGEVAARAEEILFRTMFLLQWTNFETFLRKTVEYLQAEHPQIMIRSAGRKASLSYEQVFDMSSQLSSIDDLRQELVELEIQKLRAGGQSAHGLINFLKSAFKFRDDPYEAWYVRNGERHETSYELLLGIKDRRNILTHEFDSTLDQVRQVYSVSEDDYREAELALRSVAYSIARSVYYKRYEVLGDDG